VTGVVKVVTRRKQKGAQREQELTFSFNVDFLMLPLVTRYYMGYGKALVSAFIRQLKGKSQNGPLPELLNILKNGC